MRPRSEQLRRIMPARLRYSIYFAFGGLWLSGCGWLLLHQFFESPTEFGEARHPWEPAVLLIHGILSVATAYLFGWIMARHATEAWTLHKRRISGSLLTTLLVVLAISGFALFFLSDDAWQARSAQVHEVLGLLVTLFAVEHWRVVRQPAE
jgi:FtsH-binding integral membrane protein